MTILAPVHPNNLASIGNTPMVEITRLDTGCCRLFVKNETVNPTGSIKDRIGLYMIEAAEQAGEIATGGHIVEATAGNTGLALAFVAQQKGYKLTLFVPDKMATEKIMHLRALGAEVRLTRSDVTRGDPDYYQDQAEAFAAETGAFYINQFANPANPAAHEATTGPEILAQMEGDVDAVVVGVGSGGTVTGLQRFFTRAHPQTQIIVADPEGSIITPYIRTGQIPDQIGSWLVEGIGEDFLPPVMSLEGVQQGYHISDAEAFSVVRELLLKEGLMAGSSSGTLLAAALRYCREQSRPQRVVTFLCDTGNKYLSKCYSDIWMTDHGFLPRPETGRARDVLTRRADRQMVVTARSTETLRAVLDRLRDSTLAVLPVLDETGHYLGLLTEYLALASLDQWDQPLANLELLPAQLPLSAPLEELEAQLEQHPAVALRDGPDFAGLVTRGDLIQYMKSKR